MIIISFCILSIFYTKRSFTLLRLNSYPLAYTRGRIISTFCHAVEGGIFLVSIDKIPPSTGLTRCVGITQFLIILLSFYPFILLSYYHHTPLRINHLPVITNHLCGIHENTR